MTEKTLQAKAVKAFKEAVRGVIEEHKRSGRPLSVWRRGKVVHISKPCFTENKVTEAPADLLRKSKRGDRPALNHCKNSTPLITSRG